jgi:hypothetical protein
MSRKSFRGRFLETVLSFFWREWSILGAAGGARSVDPWAIDPETLLVHSLSFARYEPRLFDEILEWLVLNGRWIDLQRLRGVARRRPEPCSRLLGTVAELLSRSAKGDQRKWLRLAHTTKPAGAITEEALFFTKEGKPYPPPKATADEFRMRGFLRSPFVSRGSARPVPVNAASTIRFLLRALFGVGSRSECILYLLTHEAGSPAEIARSVGISIRGVQDALIELSQSGAILTRVKGKRKIEYWLSQDRWWEFIRGKGFNGADGPVWVNWIDLLSGLANAWEVVNSSEASDSDYMRSSILRESIDAISMEIARSGLAVSPPPGPDVPPDQFEEEFQRFIMSIVGARNEAG